MLSLQFGILAQLKKKKSHFTVSEQRGDAARHLRKWPTLEGSLSDVDDGFAG